MKLSKQERIGAVIVAVVVILLVGIFVFIKPKIENIKTNSMSYQNKVTELTAAQQKASTKGELRDSVYAAYEDGKNLADVFFVEMNEYQVDEEFRNFLAQCDANVTVQSISMTNPSVSTLAPVFYVKPEVTYPLKSYALGNVEPTEKELAAANRQQMVMDALGVGQTVGSITVNFEVTAIDQEELIKFCDEVNNYCKMEDGKSVRKACKLNGFAFSYPLIQKEYDKLIEEITKKAEAEGKKALYDNFDMPVPKDPVDNTPTTNPGEENENDKQLSVSEYIYRVGSSITFYSVPRMQDPTDQLDAQDGIGI